MSKLDRQSIFSCHGVIARPGMPIVVVLLPTLWHGVAWFYSAGRDDTVGTMVVCQPSCTTWSRRGLRHHLLTSRGRRTGVGSCSRVIGCLACRGADDHDP